MTFCLNSNRKLFHVFALIVCKYSRFQKGLGQLTDGLSDVIESRFAVFSNSFSGKRSVFDPQKREHFQNRAGQARFVPLSRVWSLFLPCFEEMSTGNLPKEATPKKLHSPTLKIVSLISLKMLLKRQSELAGLTGHFENEISAKTHHIRVYHSGIN